MQFDEKKDTWSITDIWLGLLFLFTGAVVATLAILAVRKGQSWAIFAVAGVGGFLVGPMLMLIGLNATVRSLLSLRGRGKNRCARCSAALDPGADPCPGCGSLPPGPQ